MWGINCRSNKSNFSNRTFNYDDDDVCNNNDNLSTPVSLILVTLIIFIIYFVVYSNVYETFLVLAQTDGIWEQNVEFLDLRVYNLFSVVLHPKLVLVCLVLCFIDHTQAYTHTQTAGRTPLNKWSACRRGHYLFNTQLKQEMNIHALSGIRNRDQSSGCSFFSVRQHVLG
jgi:hypothetical protein